MRTNWEKEKSANKEDNIFIKHDDDARSISRKEPEDSSSDFESSELEKFDHTEKLEHHPLIVPINRDLNNDIYFIGK